MSLLEDKVVLVTGGTSGIGRACALLFAREGGKVAFTGRREEAGRQLLEEIEKQGREALFVRADAADPGSGAEVVKQVVARFGRLDAAFNNAGTAASGPLEELDEATWDRLIGGNLKGAFFYLRAEAAQMRAQGGGGSIVCSGSVFTFSLKK